MSEVDIYMLKIVIDFLKKFPCKESEKKKLKTNYWNWVTVKTPKTLVHKSRWRMFCNIGQFILQENIR